MTDAIAQLYRVFARYPRQATISHSPITISDDDNAALQAHAVGSVPAAVLERYLFKAMTTWGDVDTFRHYLPQLAESVAWSGDLDLFANKLAYGHWRTWPLDEQQAIEAWLRARWDAALAAGTDLWPEAEVATKLGLPCADRVARLLAATAPLPVIARLIVDGQTELYRARRFTGLDPAFDALLRSGELRARLEERFLAASGDESRDLGAALEVLHWIAEP